RLPAPRDAEPCDVRPALRIDVGGKRARVLRHPSVGPRGDRPQRAVPLPQPAPALRRAAPLAPRRLRAPARVTPLRTGLAALPPRGTPHVLAGVLRQPRLHALVRGYAERRHGVRVQPHRRDVRRDPRVVSARDRLPGTAADRRRLLRRGVSPVVAASLPRRSAARTPTGVLAVSLRPCPLASAS